jgi:hypothetical protein
VIVDALIKLNVLLSLVKFPQLIWLPIIRA